jgi:hypothetical protein
MTDLTQIRFHLTVIIKQRSIFVSPNTNKKAMTPSIQITRKKHLFVILFFLTLLVLQSIIAEAQTNSQSKNRNYYGFTGSFGTRSFKLNSGFAELNNTVANQVGGQIGLIAGNCIWQFRLGLFGYYTSTGNTIGSIDLYENNFSVNFNPLSLLAKGRSRISPYLFAGITDNRAKFYGHYASKETGNINYSSLDLPNIGSIHILRTTVGAGVTFKLIDNLDFVHFFSEVSYGYNVSQTSKYTALSSTSVGNQLNVNMGLRFGGHRLRKRSTY